MGRCHHILLLAAMAFIFCIEHCQAAAVQECFFVDGKALCGEEGIRAREQARLDLESKMVMLLFMKMNYVVCRSSIIS